MKIKHISLNSRPLTVSKDIHESCKINLDTKGFVSEELNDEQINALATNPEFIIHDDNGEPIVKKTEKKVLVVDDSNVDLKTLSEQLQAALEQKSILEAQFAEQSTKIDELELELENLKSENELLKTQIPPAGDGEKENEEELVEGQKKIDDGKAFIVKKDGKGNLKWYRDGENDPKP